MENRRPQEIDLLDLCYRIATKWRMAIILMIVCLVLVCGYKVMNNIQYNSSVTAVQEEDTTTSEEYMSKLDDTEANKVIQAFSIYSQLDQYKDYNMSSGYMNLNGYNENVVLLEYRVDTGYVYDENGKNKNDYSKDLVAAYKAYAGGLDEMVSATTDEGVQSDTMFTVKVAGVSSEDAVKLSNSVKADIKSYSEKLNSRVGSHKLKLVDMATTVIKDSELLDEQYRLSTNALNLQNNLTNITGSFTEEQNAAYNKLIEEASNVGSEENTAVEEPVTISITSGLAKYGVLGIILGIFLACCVVAVPYVLNRKIKKGEEVTEVFGMYMFGDFENIPSNSVKHNTKLDQWLYSLKNKENWTYDEQKALTIANLKLACQKSDVTDLMLTSTVHMDETCAALITDIIEGLKAAGINAVCGDNVLRNIETLEKASELGKVVLLEKVGVSTYDNIDKVCGICREQKVDILGTIIM